MPQALLVFLPKPKPETIHQEWKLSNFEIKNYENGEDPWHHEVEMTWPMTECRVYDV